MAGVLKEVILPFFWSCQWKRLIHTKLNARHLCFDFFFFFRLLFCDVQFCCLEVFSEHGCVSSILFVFLCLVFTARTYLCLVDLSVFGCIFNDLLDFLFGLVFHCGVWWRRELVFSYVLFLLQLVLQLKSIPAKTEIQPSVSLILGSFIKPNMSHIF